MTQNMQTAYSDTASVDLLPVSFSQRRLWFLDRLEPDNPAYVIPGGVRLRGDLNEEALGKALAAVIERHEVLRTSIRVVDGEPNQVIHSPMPFPLTHYDLTDLSDDKLWRAVRQHANDLAVIPFDLKTAPLVRGRLLRMASEDHVLLVAMHHIVSDGWSMGIFMRDVAAFYAETVGGPKADLPELSIQFGDYAAWQEETLSGPRLQQSLDAWRTHLEDAPALLTLPTDRPRPRTQTFRGATESFDVSAELTERLLALGREHNATLLMILTAAFGVLLGRLAGQRDVVVGTPVANRSRSELEPLIGFFINTLPLRVQFDDDPSFAGLLQRFRDVALDAYTHQDIPFERLVEELTPTRDLAYTPIFQAMLNLLNLPETQAELPGLTLETLELPDQTAKFDITLTVHEEDGLLRGFAEYNTDLFEATTIRHWLAAWATLLEAIAADPECPVSRLPLLGDAERTAAIAASEGPAIAIPQRAVHTAILERALERPKDVAISGPGGDLTWGQLSARIRSVAAALRQAGVSPGDRVAVLIERSSDLPALLLGVHAAGAAYVPLDPIYPAERIATMIEDSGATLLLTGGDLDAAIDMRLPKLLAEDIDSDPVDDVAEPDGTDDAYIIFTSGSTGRPKGVAVGHRALTNFLSSMAREPGMSEEDKLLAVTTVSFDIAALELFLPLWCGGSLTVASREEAADGERLAALLKDSGATVMQATPVTWRMLRAAGWPGDKKFRVLCGGEAMPADLATDLVRKVGGLWNLYGPTETTIWSSVSEITQRLLVQQESGRPMPIGRPIANTRMLVLDPWQEPVPPGAPGELYIGGAGVARGYHGQPDLTAERFLADPFGKAEDRLYRTGDLVRRRTNGMYEFLGRIDQQVKLRGFRIELEEIEAALRDQPAVADAAVALIGKDDRARLAAFVVTAPDTDLETIDLREPLRRRLPDYMIPSSISTIDALPLTANGKIDRKKLPGLTDAVDVRERTAPKDEIEAQVLKIWSAVMDRPDLGTTDDFFAIGGHSLLAIRLMGEINAAFDRELPLATLFQSPTVAGLAAALKLPDRPRSQTVTVPLAQGDAEIPLFVIPGAGGNPFYLTEVGRMMKGQRSVIAFEAPGLNGVDDPLRSMDAYAELYLEGIRHVQPKGPYYFLGHSFGSHVAYEITRRLVEQGETIGRFIVIDTAAPILDHNPIDTEVDFPSWVAELGRIAEVMLGRPVHVDEDYLRSHDEDAQISHLADAMARAGWITLDAKERRIRGLLNVYRSALSIFYHPTSRLPLEPVLLKAEETETGTALSNAELADPSLRQLLFRPAWGWEELFSKPVRIRKIPGSHNSIVVEPHVSSLAQVVLEEIGDAP